MRVGYRRFYWSVITGRECARRKELHRNRRICDIMRIHLLLSPTWIMFMATYSWRRFNNMHKAYWCIGILTLRLLFRFVVPIAIGGLFSCIHIHAIELNTRFVPTCCEQVRTTFNCPGSSFGSPHKSEESEIHLVCLQDVWPMRIFVELS